MKPAATLTVLLAALATASLASADPPRASPDRATQADGRGYAYTFEDDPLAADPLGATTAIIHVRPRAARATLIHPRTSFVPEILKTAEHL